MKRLIVLIGLAWAGISLAHEAHKASQATAPKVQARARAGLSVGAAVAPDGGLWLVGLDGDGRLGLRRSADRGQTWDAWRPLDIGDDKVAADGENRPKIAFGPTGQVVISYTQPLAKPYTGEIRMLRSEDGGASFTPPFTVHRDRQVITHRFESIAFDTSGTLHTVWIDKRDQVSAARGTYRGAAIYRNESRDGGRSFGPDIRVADYSCECCRIALAPTADGRVAAMWRHVFAPNIRDHAFAILGAVAREPTRASHDGWNLDACPHHGPGLAPATDGGYHAVWFGERDGRAAVRYGRLAADGSPQGDARELPDPAAEHADIAAIGERIAIVWRSHDGTATNLRAWISTDGGRQFVLRPLASSPQENDHPRLLTTPQGLIVIWRTAKEIHVLPIDP